MQFPTWDWFSRQSVYPGIRDRRAADECRSSKDQSWSSSPNLGEERRQWCLCCKRPRLLKQWWERDVRDGHSGCYTQLQQLTRHMHTDHGWQELPVPALALRHLLFSHSGVKRMTCNSIKLFLQSLQTFCPTFYTTPPHSLPNHCPLVHAQLQDRYNLTPKNILLMGGT